ncbi:MAG: hypothetical protein M1829_003604 [Trizodia sp. TS-e1964]|nr:MAG: hypothetical protein M1829_003604 [Trizodia sp. TS-e1964]
MGWWPGNSSSSGEGKPDPLSKLDPKLREFLERESPVKYSPTPSSAPPPKYIDQVLPEQQQPPSSAPKAPPPTLYPDGRYNALWAAYTPIAEVEAASKTDQERLHDVLDGFKTRRTEIGRAALENCAMEQYEVNDCFRSGGARARLTMCRAENKKLNRCFMMQGRFLKALGYLSTFDRPAEVDEAIQMHADTLYQRMLAQEAATEAARAAGLPAPEFGELIESAESAGEMDGQAAAERIEKLPASSLAQLEHRFRNLTPVERAVEEKAVAAEIRAGEKLKRDLDAFNQGKDKARLARKEEGSETIADRITRALRWQ